LFWHLGVNQNTGHEDVFLRPIGCFVNIIRLVSMFILNCKLCIEKESTLVEVEPGASLKG
jgi:hypothetical protein